MTHELDDNELIYTTSTSKTSLLHSFITSQLLTMYNDIPSERTSKRAIFVALLCCITLVSVLAAGYFAWMTKNLQSNIAQNNEVLVPYYDSEPEPSSDEAAVVPVYSFTYPVIVQPVRRTEVPEGWWGPTLLMVMISDWEDANRDSGYCTHIREYVTDEKILLSRGVTPGYIYLTDTGVRAALVSYFAVAPEDEKEFFDGIDAVMDSDDTFAQDYVMCEGAAGARKFLLLDDVRTNVLNDGGDSTQSYPEVLEWSEDATLGSTWTAYPAGEYPIMDGYRFYPDWYGNVIVRTGYGDAGYSHWQYQLLQDTSTEPLLTLLEKCNLEPTPDYEDSILTCEVEYGK